MFGISYGELFLLLGATAALIGPKDLPIIARTAGRFAGRSIGYVQLARGQFESVMQQSQARQVHKELQDTIAQLEAIRHEIRTISFLNPGPLTSRIVDNISATAATSAVESGPIQSDKESTIIESGPIQSDKESTIIENGPIQSDNESTVVENGPKSSAKERRAATVTPEDCSTRTALSDMHSQAAAYARLAETTPMKSISLDNKALSELTDESGKIVVLPVSAESAGLLPKRKDEAKGSDIVLEAILEAEVAKNAQEFLSQPQSQIKSE